jgi:hypothetical protein
LYLGNPANQEIVLAYFNTPGEYILVSTDLGTNISLYLLPLFPLLLTSSLPVFSFLSN